MRNYLSGEPDAGDPPVRFGGRGEVNPSLRPLSRSKMRIAGARARGKTLAKGELVIVGWYGVSELIFEVKEDEVDGGYSASALGYGIRTQGETLGELRANVKEAVDCYFDET